MHICLTVKVVGKTVTEYYTMERLVSMVLVQCHTNEAQDDQEKLVVKVLVSMKPKNLKASIL